jgi:hypothetical protein
MKLLSFVFLVTLSRDSIALNCFDKEPLLTDICFDPVELVKHAEIAKSLEKLNSKYLELLRDASFVVEHDQVKPFIIFANTLNSLRLSFQPGADLYMSYELPKHLQNLQFYGNTVVIFLDIAVHHLSRDYGLSRDQVLHCFSHLNLTADKYGICRPYQEIRCDERSLM